MGRNKIYMKGYKAFKKGLICSPNGHTKQYKENTIFKENNANICSNGMHFCKEPLDVLNYYPLVDEDGNMSEFAEVEALDECKTNDEEKYCTKKLKIKGKISFAQLVQASVNFDYKKIIKDNNNLSNDNGIDSTQIGSSGDYAQIGSSGNSARIGSSGDYAQIGSSGNSARIGSSGNSAQIGSSGDYAQIGSSGYSAQIGSSGYSAQIGSSGDYAQIGSSGNSAQIGSSGYSAQIGSSGYSAQIGSSGYSARIGSSGDYARITLNGENSVGMCAGMNSIIKGKKGNWITLAEWKYDENKNRYIPVCVKSVQIDGKIIKEDTFYKLKDGEFKEC